MNISVLGFLGLLGVAAFTGFALSMIFAACERGKDAVYYSDLAEAYKSRIATMEKELTDYRLFDLVDFTLYTNIHLERAYEAQENNEQFSPLYYVASGEVQAWHSVILYLKGLSK